MRQPSELRQSQEELRAGGHLRTALPDLGQVIPWKGIWCSVSVSATVHSLNPQKIIIVPVWEALRTPSWPCLGQQSDHMVFSVGFQCLWKIRSKIQEAMKNIEWIEKELNSMQNMKRENKILNKYLKHQHAVGTWNNCPILDFKGKISFVLL